MDFKKFVPHLIALAVLFAVNAVFFAPNFFNGKVLPQPDNDKARAMQTEIQDYLKKEGKAPLWTNSAFSGMPAYQIYMPIPGNLISYPYKAVLFGTNVSHAHWAQIFLAMACMYLLLSVLKVDWRIGVFGSLAYCITSYNADLLEAGHTTKIIALALMPGILAGLVLAFNRMLWLGGALMAFFTAMQVYANHVQITYYTLMLCGIYFLVKLVDAVREKNYADWTKALIVTGLSVALAFACSLSRLRTTYEYSQETIRGKSELSQRAGKGDGLDTAYLFGWSLGVRESMTLMVPHFAGGGGGETYEDTKFYNAISPQVRNQIAGLFYSGDQPFVGTAIYFGAIVCFLFFLGAWLVPGTLKYWLTAGAIFMLSLAWGKHFGLNFFWYDYLPMFKKFRAVTMALGISEFCVVVLAALGLQKMMDPGVSLEQKKKALWIAAGLSAVFCLLALFLGDTEGVRDYLLAEQPDLLSLLKEDRVSMLRSDVLRSLAFIAVAFGLLWMYLRAQVKALAMVVGISIVSLADNWMICTRTLSSDKFESVRTAHAPSPETDYDKKIKRDKDPYYRVLDLARGGLASNWVTSYYHKSMSGYHAAKLQRYQEVIDTFLSETLNANMHIVGMFNGKYVVTPNGEVIANPKACGNAWFVRHFDVVPTADLEFNALHRLNPKDTAVVQQAFAGTLQGLQIQPDSTAQIRLTHYHPDKMQYEYSARTEQLALFSEIYYPPSKGWKCFLNGQPAPDFIKANYLLRAMRLPAGQNMKLEMRFEPDSYYVGEKVNMASSIAVLLLLAGALYWWFRNNVPEDPNRLHDPLRPKRERPERATPAAKPKGGRKKN